jgi:hypothetical protein
LHADTFVLPPVTNDEHADVDSSSDEIFDSEGSGDSNIDSVQSNEDSLHADVDVEPKQRPKWFNTTL